MSSTKFLSAWIQSKRTACDEIQPGAAAGTESVKYYRSAGVEVSDSRHHGTKTVAEGSKVLAFIEEAAHVRIVSTGPGREETIFVNEFVDDLESGAKTGSVSSGNWLRNKGDDGRVLAVTWMAKAGQEGRSLPELFTKLTAESRKEPGCAMYQVHRHRTEPRRFFIYEQ